MKKFSFRLQRVLQLREDVEHERAQQLGEALQEERAVQRECSERARHLERVSEQLAPPVGEPTNAGFLRVLGFTQQAAVRGLEAAEAAREAAGQQVDAEKAKYTEARVERKVVEKLKEVQRSAWETEASREEQKHLDEVALRRSGGHRTP